MTRTLRVFGTVAVALGLCTFVAAAWMSRARASTNASPAAPGTTRVAIPLPSPGDVSYALAVVKITNPGARLARGGIFAARVGGLGVSASSSSWRRVRKTTHVYIA